MFALLVLCLGARYQVIVLRKVALVSKRGFSCYDFSGSIHGDSDLIAEDMQRSVVAKFTSRSEYVAVAQVAGVDTGCLDLRNQLS
ncbi:hypothetical protein Tco_0494097 [Tanacetum coccineum]